MKNKKNLVGLSSKFGVSGVSRVSRVPKNKKSVIFVILRESSRKYEIASGILIFNEAKRENCNCEYCNGNFCFLGMCRVP